MRVIGCSNPLGHNRVQIAHHPTHFTGQDMEMMSTDELARILGVSKGDAKSIKASLAKHDRGADAWAEYEKEFTGPDTPGISREGSIVSEDSVNIGVYVNKMEHLEPTPNNRHVGPRPPLQAPPLRPKAAPLPRSGPHRARYGHTAALHLRTRDHQARRRQQGRNAPAS